MTKKKKKKEENWKTIKNLVFVFASDFAEISSTKHEKRKKKQKQKAERNLWIKQKKICGIDLFTKKLSTFSPLVILAFRLRSFQIVLLNDKMDKLQKWNEINKIKKT